MDKETTYAAIRVMLALAWKLHKTQHLKGMAGTLQVNHEAFMDICSDAISDDTEWWRSYRREVENKTQAELDIIKEHNK